MRYRLLSCIICAAALWSCGDKGGNGGKGGGPEPPFTSEKLTVMLADIENLPAGVTFDRISADITGVDWSVIGAVEGTYNDGKFVVSLPAELDPADLCKGVRDDAGDYEGFWPAEEASDRDARVAKLGDLFAWDGGTRVGRIYLTDWSGEGSTTNKAFVYFHYADRPLTLGGSNLTVTPGANKPGGQKSFRYEAEFPAGWCAYAQIPTGSINLITTDIDDEMPLVWRFESYI